MGDIRVFWQGSILSYRALFAWFRPSAYLASKVLMPLAEMLFFVLLGTYGSKTLVPSWFVIGNAIQMASVSGIYGVTMSVAGDRQNGTLPYVLGTPANRLALFFGRASVHLVDGFVGVALGLAWGRLLFGVGFPLKTIPVLCLAIASASFSSSGMGLLMGCIGLITRNVMFVNNAVYYLLLVLSGANVPIEILPRWIRFFSEGLPLTNAIRAARLLAAGSPPPECLPPILRELLIGSAWTLAGYFLFRAFERAAKRRGSLETV
jgi:ABC-2 type transport system permease protein